MNFSARAFVRTNESINAGFALRGAASKRVLLRAAGPALGALGVARALANPRLELRDETGRLVAANDDWQNQADAIGIASAFASVGAFAFGSGSRDAALVITLPAGNYSAVVTGADGEPGVALVEVYELP
jgi:hypothetical protein